MADWERFLLLNLRWKAFHWVRLAALGRRAAKDRRHRVSDPPGPAPGAQYSGSITSQCHCQCSVRVRCHHAMTLQVEWIKPLHWLGVRCELRQAWLGCHDSQVHVIESQKSFENVDQKTFRDCQNESVLTKKNLLKRWLLPQKTLKARRFFFSFPKGLVVHFSWFATELMTISAKVVDVCTCLAWRWASTKVVVWLRNILNLYSRVLDSQKNTNLSRVNNWRQVHLFSSETHLNCVTAFCLSLSFQLSFNCGVSLFLKLKPCIVTCTPQGLNDCNYSSWGSFNSESLMHHRVGADNVPAWILPALLEPSLWIHPMNRSYRTNISKDLQRKCVYHCTGSPPAIQVTTKCY